MNPGECLPLGLRPARRISFTIVSDQIAQGRPRFTKTGHAYTDDRTAKWQTEVRYFATRAMEQVDGEVLSGPVRIVCDFYRLRPAGLEPKRAPKPPVPCPIRPDLDNLAKAILDGCNRVVYADDRQIVELLARKWYAAGPGYGDARPRVEVTIEEVGA